MSTIKTTWDGVPQPLDQDIAGSVRFRAKSLSIMIEGLNEILLELNKFESVINALELEASPYERDINRIKTIIKHGAADVAKANNEFDLVYISGASYSTLRYLKAGVLHRILTLELNRDGILADGGVIPQSVLQSFQEKIQQYEALSETGLLKGLKPVELLFDVMDNPKILSSVEIKPDDSVPYRRAQYIVVPAVQSIPILDEELRRRCLTLLAVADPVKKEQNQLDAVVREMGVVLESRIRQVSELENAKDKAGDALVSEVFKAGDPILQLSVDPKTQTSALLLFKGYFGFVRNDPAHNIVQTYTKATVLQLLGLTDYLLSLIDGARKVK